MSLAANTSTLSTDRLRMIAPQSNSLKKPSRRFKAWLIDRSRKLDGIWWSTQWTASMVLARLRGFCSCVFSIKSGTCFPSRAVFGSRIRDHKQGSNLLSGVSVLVLFLWFCRSAPFDRWVLNLVWYLPWISFVLLMCWMCASLDSFENNDSDA